LDIYKSEEVKKIENLEQSIKLKSIKRKHYQIWLLMKLLIF